VQFIQSQYIGAEKRPPAPIYETLTQPGVSLIMPSEQREDFIDGRPPYTEFINNRPRGGSRAVAHKGPTYARVFANEKAEPFLKLEDLRFPVGSVIVREKLSSANAVAPDLIAAMIKHDREFSPATNGWEFVVIDKNFSRVKTRQTTGNCASCHAQTKQSDFVFKTYLR
jgi:hypothetical protein